MLISNSGINLLIITVWVVLNKYWQVTFIILTVQLQNACMLKMITLNACM